MKSKGELLEFKGQTISYTLVGGVVYIAIRPICNALGLNVDRQIKIIKRDPILGDAYTVASTRDAENRIQKMAVLPEQYLYGWLFGVKSQSGVLHEYKKECYKVLYNYFHGSIARRNKMLMKKAELINKMHDLEEDLKKENEKYRELNRLKGEHLKISKVLKRIDEEEAFQQLSLFNN